MTGDLANMVLLDSIMAQIEEVVTTVQGVSLGRIFNRELVAWDLTSDSQVIHGLVLVALFENPMGSLFALLLVIARFSSSFLREGKWERARDAALMGLPFADVLMEHTVNVYAGLRDVKVVPVPWMMDAVVAIEACASVYHAVALASFAATLQKPEGLSSPSVEMDAAIFHANAARHSQETALKWLQDLRVTGNMDAVRGQLTLRYRTYRALASTLQKRPLELVAAYAEATSSAMEHAITILGSAPVSWARMAQATRSVFLRVHWNKLMQHLRSQQEFLRMFVVFPDEHHGAVRYFQLYLNLATALAFKVLSFLNDDAGGPWQGELVSWGLLSSILLRHKLASTCALLSSDHLSMEATGFVSVQEALERHSKGKSFTASALNQVKKQRLAESLRHDVMQLCTPDRRERLRGPDFVPLAEAQSVGFLRGRDWPREDCLIAANLGVTVVFKDIWCSCPFGSVEVHARVQPGLSVPSIEFDIVSIESLTESAIVRGASVDEVFHVKNATGLVIFKAPLVDMRTVTCGGNTHVLALIKLKITQQDGQINELYDCFFFRRVSKNPSR